MTEESISEDALKNSSAKWVKENSTLIAMYGATAGVVARLLIDATINQAICALEPQKNIVNDFLFYVCKFSSQKLLSEVQGSGQPNLSGGQIKLLKIPLPPIAEQLQITSILESIGQLKLQRQRQLQNYSYTKNSLMQDLLTGKVRVTVN